MLSLAKSAAMPFLKFATRGYVAGETLDDGMALASRVAELGFASTLCYWNDGTEEPDRVADEYCAVLEAIGSAGMDGALAMKLPALWEQTGPTDRVIDTARRLGLPVVIDSHDPHKSDDIIRTLDRVGPDGLGWAIPGRWRRSLEDVEIAVEMGVRVRVVKGQWPDPEEPDMDLSEGYMRVIEALAGRARLVGVATHDAPLAARAMEVLAGAGTPFEQEFVYPLPVAPALAEGEKYRVPARLYIPYGAAWLPYSVSRALKNPQVLYYLGRDLMLGRRFKCPPRKGRLAAQG